MDLPTTSQGNKHVLVFQDLFTKWLMVYPVPDQKSERIVTILVDEIVPFCGVLEALLSDRGANLLLHLMRDVCELLGTTKLNTTAYHPQCDGLVERYNRTLKTAVRKHAARFGVQWNRFFSGVVWSYRSTPHKATHKKPSYLLFGLVLEALLSDRGANLLLHLMRDVCELLGTTKLNTTAYHPQCDGLVERYNRTLKTVVRKHAARFGVQWDRIFSGVVWAYRNTPHKAEKWPLRPLGKLRRNTRRFQADETGRMRKLSRPWHGPYRVEQVQAPDVTVEKVYRPQDGAI